MRRNKKTAEKYDSQRDERAVDRSTNSRRPKRSDRRSKRRDDSRGHVDDKGLDAGKFQKKNESSAYNTYNDLSYYFKDKTLLENATQLAFQNFIGDKGIDKYAVPSIMTIPVNPSCGTTFSHSIYTANNNRRFGINMSALKLFNRLSMSSGRNMAYAPQDVATAILGMSQLAAMYSYVKRALGCINLTNYYNRMFPRAIVEAMGFDYDDLVAHYAEYRTRINAEFAACAQIPLLMNCGFLEKSLHQFDHIFTDDDSPMAQVYMYVPFSTWILDETSYQGGTVCKTTPVVWDNSAPMMRVKTQTMQSFITNILRPMIDALLTSSTINLVYADLLNLASKVSDLKFYQFELIPEDYVVFPIKDYEALLHIHNLKTARKPDCPTLGTNVTPLNDVYPDPDHNTVRYNPGFSTSVVGEKAHFLEHVLIDSPMASPDVTVRGEIFRYVSMHTENFETVNKVKYAIDAVLPDYYPVCINVYTNIVTNSYAGGYDPLLVLTPMAASGDIGTISQAAQTAVSQFDWAPMLITYDATNSKGEITAVHGDLNFFTVVDDTYMERLNDVVFLGLFDMG